jgi:hypothetical protein
VGEIRHNAAAVAQYLRAMECSARDLAVAEAEAEVCRAWGEELDRVRRVTQLAVASARDAHEAARSLALAQQGVGDPAALDRARRRLEGAAVQERRSRDTAAVLLAVVTEELELLALAADEREAVALANRLWVASASRAACASAAQVRIAGYFTATATATATASDSSATATAEESEDPPGEPRAFL